MPKGLPFICWKACRFKSCWLEARQTNAWNLKIILKLRGKSRKILHGLSPWSPKLVLGRVHGRVFVSANSFVSLHSVCDKQSHELVNMRVCNFRYMEKTLHFVKRQRKESQRSSPLQRHLFFFNFWPDSISLEVLESPEMAIKKRKHLLDFTCDCLRGIASFPHRSVS